MQTKRLREILRELDLESSESRRVLLVDNLPLVLATLSKLLESSCDLLTASSGEEALELLSREGEVDLVISDQRMSGMTGVELLTKIAERYPSTVRVMLTGYSEAGSIVDAVNRCRVFRFLPKPFNQEEVQEVVDEALERKAVMTSLHSIIDRLAEQSRALSMANLQLVTAHEELISERLQATLAVVHRVASDLRLQLALTTRLTEECATDLSREIEEAHVVTRSMLEQLECLDQLAAGTTDPILRQPKNANQLLTETIGLFGREPRYSERRVVVDSPPEIGDLFVDESLTRQALLALLRNAADASPETTSIQVTLEVRGETDVCIAIRDEGSGMRPEELGQAMGLFFSGFEGAHLGMGLPLSRMVAERHGGVLEIDSQKGRGTCARMTLSDAHRKGGAQ
jgi:signal transduction histidine kinase